MQKKKPRLIVRLLLFVLACALCIWAVQQLIKSNYPQECAFCSEAVLKKQTLYEGRTVLVLSNFAPLLPGHAMIVPKRHVSRFEEITPEENEEVRQTINKVQRAFQKVYGTDQYLLALQNGSYAGQTVPHVHFHMLPRTKNNAFTKMKLWWAMMNRIDLLISPLNAEQLEQQYGPLKQALNQLDVPD